MSQVFKMGKDLVRFEEVAPQSRFETWKDALDKF